MRKLAIVMIVPLFLLGVRSFNAVPEKANEFRNSIQKPAEEYKLVWSDEFNTDGAPKAENWIFEKGFKRNHELQWYQEKNARCSKGLLVIEARRVHLKNPNFSSQSKNWKTNRPDIEYTSSSINTSGIKSWKYGRFIMRGKIDVDQGIWPAFWTLGIKGSWPSNGEIDIMEYYKGNLLANIACGTDTAFKAKWYSKKKAVSSFSDPDWIKKFHTWRMDWDDQEISLYVDDLLLNRVELSKLVNKDGSNINPFKQPHYLLLNLAVGGDNGGDPATTTFPRRYEIDYVRVYQK